MSDRCGREACFDEGWDCCAGCKDAEAKEEVGKGKQQQLESKRRLSRIRHRTSQKVSSVRVGSDHRENQRRIAEEQTRQVSQEKKAWPGRPAPGSRPAVSAAAVCWWCNEYCSSCCRLCDRSCCPRQSTARGRMLPWPCDGLICSAWMSLKTCSQPSISSRTCARRSSSPRTT